ncbi:hypothetical protein MVEN_01664000 [Mycena venus]|uniref:Uncharacterized protein n=1 Tax=Mycena venus TaxID=2733690 RepID=A0A8H7CQY8_9AGAR|nr:hypothetical protein MVEN_01664000 [Mycena venus]
MVALASRTLLFAVSSCLISSAFAQRVFCTEYNKINGPLNGTASNDAGGFNCTYIWIAYQDEEKPCSYVPNGTFYQGPQNCPESIAFFDFLCLSFDGLTQKDEPDGNPLSGSLDASFGGVLTRTCAWVWNDGSSQTPSCTYLLTNGSLQDQSQLVDCPPTINPTQLNSTGYDCSPTDIRNSSLIGASVTHKQDLACTYGNGSPTMCMYDTKGSLDSGPSGCPPSANPIQAPGNSSMSGAMCLQTDNTGADLISASLDSGYDTLSCLYDKSGICAYYTKTNGTLKSGGSSCPPSIAPGSGPVGHVPIGAISSSDKPGSLAAVSSSNGRQTNNNIPQPIIIALLAMNGFLVAGVLVLGGMWLLSDRSTTKPHRYKEVDSTRGLDHDSYYDMPDLPYRS